MSRKLKEIKVNLNLSELESVSKEVMEKGKLSYASFRFEVLVTPEVILAMVEKIRDLESHVMIKAG